jgi:hypothetical protein
MIGKSWKKWYTMPEERFILLFITDSQHCLLFAAQFDTSIKELEWRDQSKLMEGMKKTA